jgi:hypothetical protein
MTNPLSPKTAQRHEALYLRLAALLRQAEAVAARRPDTAVPDAMRALAETLVYDARAFTGTGGGRRPAGLPAVPPAYGGLAAALGEAFAGLEAFELRHTRWDAGLKCVVWRTSEGPQPVQRLHPEPAAPPASKKGESEMLKKVRQMIIRGREGAYDNGYRAGYLAGAGTPWPRDDEIPTPTYSTWRGSPDGLIEEVQPGRKM